MSNPNYSGQTYDENENLPLPPAYYESRPPYPVQRYSPPPGQYVLPPARHLPQAYYPQPQPYFPPSPQVHLVYHISPPTYYCPFCRSPYPPLTSQRISSSGWTTFAILLVLFFPLCWIGLLMKDNYQYCGQCQSRLN